MSYLEIINEVKNTLSTKSGRAKNPQSGAHPSGDFSFKSRNNVNAGQQYITRSGSGGTKVTKDGKEHILTPQEKAKRSKGAILGNAHSPGSDASATAIQNDKSLGKQELRNNKEASRIASKRSSPVVGPDKRVLDLIKNNQKERKLYESKRRLEKLNNFLEI